MKALSFFLLLVSLYSRSQTNSLLPVNLAGNQIVKDKETPASLVKPNNYLSRKKVQLPLVMVTYGILALEVEAVEKINESIKDEITEDHAGFKTRVDDYLQFAPASTAFILQGAGIKGKHNLKDKTIIYITSFAIMMGTIHTLKRITSEQRPDGSKFNTFPSGHTANAFMGAEFLMQEYRAVSNWYGYAGYTVAATTGLLRMYNNRHWFSDVLAGAGIGLLSAKAGYWLFYKIKKLKNKETCKPVVAY